MKTIEELSNNVRKKATKREVYLGICEDFKDEPLVNRRQLSDILDGITNGEMRRKGYDLGASHTQRNPTYWKTHKVGEEAFAHFTSALATNNVSAEQLVNIFPKSYEIYKEIMQL